MATTTKPIILDETGQAIVAAIQGISLGNYVVVEINNPRFGTVTGGGIYPTGATCTLTATPSTGCYFLAWKNANGQIVSTEPTYTFAPSSNTYLTAMFSDQDVEVVAWNNPDATKISAMIQAAYDGKIGLSDYWSVGDTRTISLSAMAAGDGMLETHEAQDIEMVIMDFNCMGFKLASDGTTTPKAIVGMKNCLKEGGKMQTPPSGDLNAWYSNDRRTWCKNTFRNAFPISEVGLFRQFRWSVGTFNGAETALKSCDDYFAFPLMKTVVGTGQYVRAEETALYENWDWYETAENRIKKLNGTNSPYWLSSAAGDLIGSIRDVGTPTNSPFGYALGLSLFGVI